MRGGHLLPAALPFLNYTLFAKYRQVFPNFYPPKKRAQNIVRLFRRGQKQKCHTAKAVWHSNETSCGRLQLILIKKC